MLTSENTTSSQISLISSTAITSSYYPPTFYYSKALSLALLAGSGFFIVKQHGSFKIGSFTVNPKYLNISLVSSCFLGIFSSIRTSQKAKEAQEKATQALFKIRRYEGVNNFRGALNISRSTSSDFETLGLKLESQQFKQMSEQLLKKHLKEGYIRMFFDEQNKPSQKLIKIVRVALRGISNLYFEGFHFKSFYELDKWVRENFIYDNNSRKTHQLESNKENLKPLLEQLGFIHEVKPSLQHYSGVLFPGKTNLNRFRDRIFYLVEQWNQGIRFENLHFLALQRKLDPTLESEQALLSSEGNLKIKQGWVRPSQLPETEIEMMQFVWNQADLPEGMRAVPTHFFLGRALLSDAVTEWQKSTPREGNYLIVSEAPYLIRHDLIFRRNSPQTFNFDTTGWGANEDEQMALFIDELGRIILEYHKPV